MFEILEIIDGIRYLSQNADEIDGKDLGTRIIGFTNPRTGSIVKRAKKSICQFPLLVSTSISSESYTEVSAMLERLYANYMRMTIVNNAEIINIQQGESIDDVVSRVHQNDYANYGFPTPERLVSDGFGAFSESYFINTYKKEEINNYNREMLKPYIDNFNTLNMNIMNEAHGNNIHLKDYDNDEEANANATATDKYIETDRRIRQMQESMSQEQLQNSTLYNNLLTQRAGYSRNVHQRMAAGTLTFEELEQLNNYSDTMSSATRDRNSQNLKDTKTQLEIEKMMYDIQHRRTTYHVNHINTDITIKKNNELEPSILELELVYNNGQQMRSTKVSLGVKTISHLIPYSEMCYFIPRTLIKKKATFRFIQWTTGEIKFVKDFLLNLKEIKFEATTEKKSIRWWKHLHSRSNASRIRNAMNSKTPIIPNATIVLSMSDIEFMKIKDNIDLFDKNKEMVNRLMDYFFLINFVIVDDADNMIYLWDDASKDYERYTFRQLDKETKDAMKRNNRISLR